MVDVDMLVAFRAMMALNQQKRWEEFQKKSSVSKTAEKKRPAGSKSDADSLQKLQRQIGRDLAFRRKDVRQMTVAELLKLYSSGLGGDDAAGPEFERRGTAARDELI
jgi:hypothetical protein